MIFQMIFPCFNEISSMAGINMLEINPVDFILDK